MEDTVQDGSHLWVTDNQVDEATPRGVQKRPNLGGAIHRLSSAPFKAEARAKDGGGGLCLQ